MGLTFVKVTVGNPANGHRREDVVCLVDSGAIYSLIPGTVLRKLHIKPHSTREFVLANGDVIRRRLATATFEYDDAAEIPWSSSASPVTIPCSARPRSMDSDWCWIRFGASCDR